MDPPLPYTEPEWSGCTNTFKFEVIKNGVLVQELPIDANYLVAGRLPHCQISLEHASISRYHAVIQTKVDGTIWVYDLSTHGTFVNKTQIPTKEFVQLSVGDMVRFGHSSRLYVLFGPQTEVEEEYEPPYIPPVPIQEDDGVNWGEQEDAFEGDEFEFVRDDVDAINVQDVNTNAYYFKDPKKSLKVWFDNRGLEFELDVESHSDGYMGSIRLPLRSAKGIVMAHGIAPKKVNAERAACLDACHKLDVLGILRQDPNAIEDAKKRKIEAMLQQDRDLDAFYDRTDKKKKVETVQRVDNMPSLVEKRRSILAEMKALETRMGSIQTLDEDEEDELDKFMAHVQNDLQQESYQKMANRHAELAAELSTVEKMMAVLDPNVQLSPLNSKNGEPLPLPTKQSIESQPQAPRPKQPQVPQLQESRPKQPQAKQQGSHNQNANKYDSEDIVEWTPPDMTAKQSNASYGY